MVRVDKVSKSIDGVKILDNITFTIRPGEKAAILSRNDLATTVMMQILAGELEPDQGSVTWGQTTERSYIPRDINPYFTDENLDILEWLRQYADKEESDNTFLRGFLGKMLFSGEDVLKNVTKLSGGEKVRCMISKMMLSKANVLLLDDPTNHLDLESITALNEGLTEFKSSIIMTSHDHEFIQTTADHIIEVSDRGVVERADTTYDEFLQHEVVQQQVEQLYRAD